MGTVHGIGLGRLVLALALLLGACAPPPAPPLAAGGGLDLRGWSFEQDGPVRLDGEWTWHWRRLIAPADTQAPPTGGFVVPGVWNGRTVAGQVLPGQGFATFRLKVRLPRPGGYGLLLRFASGAYTLWVDGAQVAGSGVVGETAERTITAAVSRAASFTAERDEITLTLHLANFQHARGGPRASVILGTPDQLRGQREAQLLLHAFVLGCVALIVVYQVALYLLRPREPAPLCLALFCLAVGLWIAMQGPILFTLLLPGAPWWLVIHVEYLALYLSPCAAVLFVHTLYPREVPRLALLLALTIFLGRGLLVLATPPRWFTGTLAVNAVLTSSVTAAYVVFVLRAARRRRAEAALFSVGLLALFCTVAIDTYHTLARPVYATYVTPVGLLALALMQAIVLSRRSAQAHLLVETQAAQLKRQSAAYYRFVPRAFLKLLGKDDIADVRLGDQIQREMTVLFADVRDFTALSERMTLAENFAFVNDLLGVMSPVIREHGGFIDKYLGDGIMALFPDRVEDGLQAAIEIRRGLRRFNEGRAARALPPIRIGIGVHTGTLMLGTVGEPERMDGTVIADAVNTAARLEGLTKLYGVTMLISEPTLKALREPQAFRVRALGLVRPKGKLEPVAVYEVFDGDPGPLQEHKRATRASFEAALRHYQRGQFTAARGLFERVLSEDPDDTAAAYYLGQATRHAAEGPPPGWSGVEALADK